MNCGSYQSIIYLDIWRYQHESTTFCMPIPLMVQALWLFHFYWYFWDRESMESHHSNNSNTKIHEPLTVHTWIFISSLWSFSLLHKLGKNMVFSQTVILDILSVEGPIGCESQHLSPPSPTDLNTVQSSKRFDTI